ncbi:MAG: tRNA pseudouridine(38-40) synthase TruA [Clostridia bacterium]|nr:tRNA pseudouridine(38-40) synthase TruA [Clostridia bacterium]
MKLLIELSYVGTNYCGYQVQQNGDTIQQRLNEAALSLFGFPCDVSGCSRTDSGVHARTYFATVCRKDTQNLECSIPLFRIPMAFNAHLPDDIAVRRALYVDSSFHPRYDVRSKTYRYRMLLKREREPFLAPYCWHVPYPTLPDAEQRMDRAAGLFCGKRDFSTFMAKGSKIEDPVRTVLSSRVFREDCELIFEICADGFLYHMVRIMAGTLIEVACGRMEPQSMTSLMEARDRELAGPTAPPCGLTLWDVQYGSPT